MYLYGCKCWVGCVRCVYNIVIWLLLFRKVGSGNKVGLYYKCIGCVIGRCWSVFGWWFIVYVVYWYVNGGICSW